MTLEQFLEQGLLPDAQPRRFSLRKLIAGPAMMTKIFVAGMLFDGKVAWYKRVFFHVPFFILLPFFILIQMYDDVFGGEGAVGVFVGRRGWEGTWLEGAAYIVGFYLFLVVLLGLFQVGAALSGSSTFRRRMVRRWGGQPVDATTIAKAAIALREWKTMSVSAAIDRYGEDVIMVLAVAYAVSWERGRLVRAVSIKAIEQDREAGPEDE